MSVQFLPEYFTARRPSKSEQIFQQLAPVGQALGASLQNTVQNFYDQQKVNRQTAIKSKAAEAFASLPQYKSIPGIKDILMGTEPQQWEPLMKQVSASRISGMNLGGDISNLIRATGGKGMGGSITQPAPVTATAQPPPEQEMPTSATTAANLAAAQRLGDNGAGYLTGNPDPFSPQGMMQRRGEEGMGQPMVPPQQPMAEEEPKPIFLGDLSPGQYQNLRNSLPQDAAEAADKIRDNQRKIKAEETKAETGKGLLEEKKKSNERKEADKALEPVINEINSIRSSLPEKQALNNLQERAIKSGDFTPFSYDHIVTMLGRPELVGAPASEFQFAIKHKMIEGVRDATGRPNMFLERTLISAAGEVGKRKSANLALAHGAQYLTNLDQAKVNAWDEIEQKYLNDPSYGYVPKRAASEYHKKVMNYAQKAEKNLMYQLQEDEEFEKGPSELANAGRRAYPTPWTDKAKEAYTQKAKDELTRVQPGKTPSKQNVLKYAVSLAKKDNLIIDEGDEKWLGR